MQPPLFLVGKHRQRGHLWASIDPQAHHTGSAISETRFGGYLKPFPSEADARAALEEAGAEQIEQEHRRRRGR